MVVEGSLEGFGSGAGTSSAATAQPTVIALLLLLHNISLQPSGEGSESCVLVVSKLARKQTNICVCVQKLEAKTLPDDDDNGYQ